MSTLGEIIRASRERWRSCNEVEQAEMSATHDADGGRAVGP
jgi:hypothetical protein